MHDAVSSTAGTSKGGRGGGGARRPGGHDAKGVGHGSGSGAPGASANLQLELNCSRTELQQLTDGIAAAERAGGYAAARSFFETYSQSLTHSLHWRAHLELAECAKRGAAVTRVKHHLSLALQAQPRTVQVWLEACRTLDELGELEECRQILECGITCSAMSEQLYLKLARILERVGDHAALRELAGSLRMEPPERVCKVLLETAHFEVRVGNGVATRPFLGCLMLRLPHQGPIYCEVCRIEGIAGSWRKALAIAEHGVQTCVKYGPLWFVLLRLAEKTYHARAVRDYSVHALHHICHELHWKVHFEVAAAWSRESCLNESRDSIGRAAICAPKHLRWKVWLLAARSELWDGSVEISRKLLAQAREDAPQRVQVAVCIELSRTEEFLGRGEEARAALTDAHACEGHDWKVFLEHIFMEARQGYLAAAKKAAMAALDLHPATGRLWSALIALEHSDEGGASSAMAAFRRAVREVPKSGEVWCEGARVFMNPLGAYFHLGRAQKCLEFAVHLTPQYGDSFLELLRLRFLLEIQARMRTDPLTIGLLGPPQSVGSTARATPDDNSRSAMAALVACRVRAAVEDELKGGRFAFSSASNVIMTTAGDSNGGVQCGDGAPNLQLSHLEVLCAYADPNYGFLWFWCRKSALSTPREVLLRMHEKVSSDLTTGGTLWAYISAIANGVFGLRTSDNSVLKRMGAAFTNDTAQRAGDLDGHAGGLVVGDFALGSLRLSRSFVCSAASLEQGERRRLIFGSDILCV